MRPRPLAPGVLVLATLAATVALGAPSGAELKKILKGGDAAAVKAALEGGALDAEGVKAVLDVVEDAKGGQRLHQLDVYESLVAGLGSARGPAADELVKAYKKARRGDVRFLVIESLGKVPEPAAEQTLLEALEKDEDEPVTVLAARQLARRGTASAVDALIPLLKKFEKDAARARLVREINGALSTLTGQSGLAVADDWKNWWDSHKAEYQAPAQPSGGDAGSQTRDRNAIDRMRRERPADLQTMTRMRDDDVLVVKAKMDEIEDVLKSLDVKHKVVEQGEFESSVTLDPTRQVLVLNCPGMAKEAFFNDATIAKIKDFVSRGGYLFCSDLHLNGTLAKAFPDVIRKKGVTSNTDREPLTIHITPHRDAASHPLMRDVFPLGSWTEQQFAWKLFMKCEVPEPNPAITTLVVSPELPAIAGGQEAVAFTFTYPPSAGGGRVATGGGRGRRPQGGVVLHVLSHFKLQKGDDGDGFALQQILLNLIIEKQEVRKAAASAGN